MKPLGTNHRVLASSTFRVLVAVLASTVAARCAPIMSPRPVRAEQVQEEAQKERAIAAAEQTKLTGRLTVVSDRLRESNSGLCQAVASGKDAINAYSESNANLAVAASSSDQPGAVAATSCAEAVTLTEDDTVNASTDGKTIRVTTGLVRFVETDDELALVVSHEMAHISLGHVQKQRGNVTIGLIGGAVIGGVISGVTGVNVVNSFMEAGGRLGQGVHSQDFEGEADYVGTYYATRAGYDISTAANVWRRFATLHPGSIEDTWGSDHPSTPERFVALEETSKEILAKKAKGQPLIPEMR